MDDATRSNLELWEEWTDLHVASEFYDVDSFIRGTRPIRISPRELEAIGEVRGKDLLHLQCHFGMDTLSFARLGARVKDINAAARRLLTTGGEADLNDILSAGGVFRRSESRLATWLETHQATRLVHGHTPHGRARPDVYQGGRAISFDGSFSRFYGSRYRHGPRQPAATVGPLPPLVD